MKENQDPVTNESLGALSSWSHSTTAYLSSVDIYIGLLAHSLLCSHRLRTKTAHTHTHTHTWHSASRNKSVRTIAPCEARPGSLFQAPQPNLPPYLRFGMYEYRMGWLRAYTCDASIYIYIYLLNTLLPSSSHCGLLIIYAFAPKIRDAHTRRTYIIYTYILNRSYRVISCLYLV